MVPASFSPFRVLTTGLVSEGFSLLATPPWLKSIFIGPLSHVIRNRCCAADFSSFCICSLAGNILVLWILFRHCVFKVFLIMSHNDTIVLGVRDLPRGTYTFMLRPAFRPSSPPPPPPLPPPSSSSASDATGNSG